MKKRRITGLLAVAVAVAFGGIGIGATAGKLLPSVGQLFGAKTIRAESLSVEAATPLVPAGSGFTYQGRLKNGGSPANGQYDFQFALYDAPAGPNLVAGPIPQLSQTVSEGLFTVLLDFGTAAFNGDARYLEISVRPTGGGGYTGLGPRQPITPAPYALYALKTKGYKNVVTVSPEGGDYTSVQTALNSITTNSATNKYLVWVGPGTYTETVTMKQWVDIEGAGEKATKITFTGNAGFVSGTLFGASNAELRSLSVENTGGNTFATAIFNSAASPSLLHVTATASGGTNNTGVLNSNSSSPTMSNITATASGGASNSGVYNDTSSPTMSNVIATAFGGTNNYGVYNLSSPASMNNVIATASGGTSSNSGVLTANSSPSMNNVTATASGGFTSYGVSNSSSITTVRNSSISASGATNGNYGVYSFSGAVTIENSKIAGSTNSINNISEVVTVGASQLSGGPVSNGGTLTCAASFTTSGTTNEPLNINCTTKELIDNVVTVGKSGADFTTVTAALNYITGNSSMNKYLVKVGPGVYTERVTMKQWVDIEGSGEKTTKVTLTGYDLTNTGTVVGASNAELRSLTVENTGGDSYAIAIYNDSTSPSLLHVTATSSGGSVNFGVYNTSSSSTMNNVTITASGGSNSYGVLSLSSSPTMNNVTITASGGNRNYGVVNTSSSPTMNNVTITASGGSNSYGVVDNSSSPTINSSTIIGSTNTIFNNDGTAVVGVSKLSGGPVSGGVTCAGVFDENYTFFASTCP